ncbi:MAG: formylglycine-generating enzyme family protein [Myxococcales bacterium]|nr:formylglycine-generating enzyme family protein [Myxococcales bacterium]
MKSTRIVLTIGALSLLGCAKGKEPPAKTALLTIGNAGGRVTATFGSSAMCKDSEVGDFCSEAEPPRTLPAMQVDIPAFQIDAHEVTNLQYQHCVAHGACSEPMNKSIASLDSAFRGYYDEESSEFADFPVVNVTWEQAKAYCAFAGKRLPTEVEWEVAARFASQTTGGKSGNYPWGDDPDDCRTSEALVSLRGCNATFATPQPVQGKMTLDEVRLDASSTLSGMAGNVSEWVSDVHNPEFGCDKPIDEFKNLEGFACRGAYDKCDDKDGGEFRTCAGLHELCEECRTEADTLADVNPACYGQCLDRPNPLWICGAHQGVVENPAPATPSDANAANFRSVRGGNFGSTDLCEARLADRAFRDLRSLDKGQHREYIGFRCAKDL